MAPVRMTLYLYILFGFCAFCHAQDPVATVTHNGDSGVIGDIEGVDFELVCLVQNLNGKVVVWGKDNAPITSDPGKYEMTANETTGIFTLTIINVTHSDDSGTYHCEVYNNLDDITGTYVTRSSIQVDVYYFPDEGNPSCYGQSVIEEGILQTFRCLSEPGDPLVVAEWNRDIGIIDPNSIVTERFTNGSKYVDYSIVPSQLDIGLNMTCTISSEVIFPGMTSSCTIGPIVLQYRPSDVQVTNITYSEGNTTYDALFCSATAYPPHISYMWSFNTPLDSSQQMITNNNQTLVILNITMCDEFPIIVTCLAANNIGNGTAMFTLCVPPPPTATTELTTQGETTPENIDLSTTLETLTTTPETLTTTDAPLQTEPESLSTANGTMIDSQAGVLTPAIFAIIIGGGIILLALIIGVIYIATTRKTEDEIQKDEIHDEAPENVYNIRNVRALSIAFIDEDELKVHAGTTVDNQGFEDGSDQETDILKGSNGDNMTGIKWTTDDADQHTSERLNDDDKEQQSDNQINSDDKAAETQDDDGVTTTSKETDLDNDDKDTSESNDKETSHHGDKEDDKTSYHGDKEDDKTGYHADKDDEKTSDHGGKEDDKPCDNGDKKDDKTSDHGEKDNDNDDVMVTPLIEDRVSYPTDPRKSLIQEALLAIQVVNTDSTARGGLKVTQEMQM